MWRLRDGRADPGMWMRSAYADRTLVTRVGTRHAMIADGSRVLVTTGSGYGTATSTW